MYSSHLCSWCGIHVHFLQLCCQQSSNKSQMVCVEKRKSASVCLLVQYVIFLTWKGCVCVFALHMWHTYRIAAHSLPSIVVWHMPAWPDTLSLSRSVFQDILQERLIKCPLLRPVEPLRPIPHLLTPTRRPCTPLEVPIPSRTSMLR